MLLPVGARRAIHQLVQDPQQTQPSREPDPLLAARQILFRYQPDLAGWRLLRAPTNDDLHILTLPAPARRNIGQLADVSSTRTIAVSTCHRTRPRSPPPAAAHPPVAIVVITAMPGTFPSWMKIEQGVCGVLLLGVAALINGTHLRSMFASQ